MDDGRALMAVDAAAKEAAIAAVAELLAGAEKELERANEERQQILARGHL